MMNGLDVLIVLLVVGIAALQAFRGFGRASFDVLAVYGALWVANTYSVQFSHTIHLRADDNDNLSTVFCLTTIVGVAIALLVSRFVYGATMMDAGMFDPFLGFVAGLAVGIMCAHSVVKTIDISDPDGKGSGIMIAQGLLGNETLNFTTYHSMMNTVTGASTYHREFTDPSK
jgi:uncharacterized membrane protein required for colicin V production